jgi:hypothetical protein
MYNVATWNLSNRRARGHAPDAIQVNGRPLVFYHFSGFDSGAQETMLKLYGSDSPALFDLRRWYLDECESQGQATLGHLPCVYSRYTNGEPITKLHRLLYRERRDLQAAFPDPFDTADVNRSYWHWFQANGQAELESSTGGPRPGNEAAAHALARQELMAARQELEAIKRSRSWKLACMMTRAAAVWR